MSAKAQSRVLFMGAVVLACSGTALAQYTIRGLTPLRWGQSDAAVGLSGATLEDFEDVNLAPGLAVKWYYSTNTLGPVTTLSRVFNPATNDPNGAAFVSGQWDGTSGLVSGYGNQTYNYFNATNWGDVELVFDPPVTAVGFSLQQADAEVNMVVNGTSIGGLASKTGLAMNGQRNGYFVVAGAPGSTISTLKFDNTGGDGFLIDHVLFTTQLAPVVNVKGYAPAPWPRDDREFGVTGAVEDFEDVSLAPGVQVGWETGTGTTPGSSTLPRTFAPATQDTFGNAFVPGVWDGTRCVINTRDNATHAYTGTNEWGDIALKFAPAVHAVAFSFEQAEGPVRLLVNGRDVGEMLSLAGWTTNSGRQGFVRIDTACAEAPISEVRLVNNRLAFGGDGFAIDHLMFGVPVSIATQPVNTSTCRGGKANLLVVAAGTGPFTYQWRHVGVPIDTLANPTAATANLQLTNVQAPSLTGAYDCVVSAGACASVTTDTVYVGFACFGNKADIASRDGSSGCDGQLTPADVVLFFQSFFGGCIAPGSPCADADITDVSGLGNPDGKLTASDVVAFFSAFFGGCPA